MLSIAFQKTIKMNWVPRLNILSSALKTTNLGDEGVMQRFSISRKKSNKSQQNQFFHNLKDVTIITGAPKFRSDSYV